MSLDVYLEQHDPIVGEEREVIFIRENGQMREISQEEWRERWPHIPPVTATVGKTNVVYSASITHNLTEMAAEAGIYMPLWRPDEIGITKASQLIAPLKAGVEWMKAEPSRFEALNPKNGWGSYEAFIPWIERYLEACVENPDAHVRVSR